MDPLLTQKHGEIALATDDPHSFNVKDSSINLVGLQLRLACTC